MVPNFIVISSEQSDIEGVSAFTEQRSTAKAVILPQRGPVADDAKKNLIQNNVYKRKMSVVQITWAFVKKKVYLISQGFFF